MLSILKARWQQGHRTIGYPDADPVVPDRLRGLPVIDTEKCPAGCRACIDACPTEAIAPEGYFLDASKCISYLTIELRDQIPVEFKDQMDNWMFGCDVCQDVCPWNRFAERHQEPAFEPHPDLLHMNSRDWQELTEEVFGRVFKKSAVKRVKFLGLKRNIGALSEK